MYMLDTVRNTEMDEIHHLTFEIDIIIDVHMSNHGSSIKVN